MTPRLCFKRNYYFSFAICKTEFILFYIFFLFLLCFGVMFEMIQKTRLDECFQDFVVLVEPQYVPRDLLAYIECLSLRCKCFVSFHRHNSSLLRSSQLDDDSKKLADLKFVSEQFGLGLKDSRDSYDFGFIFIWISGKLIFKKLFSIRFIRNY